ncbi:MAG: hypothetical protein ACD_16C00190G0009 [uncultured bacterium]|nr:MAG: hypothetical protein ACD_16C00190G0009 [uncultured bacterium]
MAALPQMNQLFEKKKKIGLAEIEIEFEFEFVMTLITLMCTKWIDYLSFFYGSTRKIT